MTRLTKIPMIAAFSAVIASFAITGEAAADRGDGRGGNHYQQRGDSYRGDAQYRGRAYNQPSRSYQRESNRSYQRDYRGDRRQYATQNHGDRHYGGNRYDGRRYDSHRNVYNHRDTNRRWSDNRYRGNDDWRGDRRWADNRYRGHDSWRHGDRRHYSGYHGGYHGRPYYRHNNRYDYYRHYSDRNYYWNHRHHYSSWRPYYGPVWGGYRHGYWNDRGCTPVTRYWTWDGRPALVGGVQCYDPRGVAFIVSDGYTLLNYY